MFSLKFAGSDNLFLKESTEFDSSFEIGMKKKEEHGMTPRYLRYIMCHLS